MNVLDQINRKDGEPAKLIRCPSCLQIKPAEFVHTHTGKEYCKDCALKFEKNGKAVLNRNGQASFPIVNDEGEVCFLSREQKRVLYLLRHKNFKYRYNLAEAVAEALDRSTDWVREQIKCLEEEGFQFLNQKKRRSAFIKYVLANVMRLKVSGQTSYDLFMELAEAIADETGYCPKTVRSMVRMFLKDMSINALQLDTPSTNRILQTFKKHPYRKFTVHQLADTLGHTIPHNSIKGACERLARKGTLHREKESKLVYFHLA